MLQAAHVVGLLCGALVSSGSRQWSTQRHLEQAAAKRHEANIWRSHITKLKAQSDTKLGDPPEQRLARLNSDDFTVTN